MKTSRVLFIVGPTASGKSQLALEIAQKFGGEIVNADSLQVYTPLNIGTAKPPLTERQQLPHHLFDIVEAGGTFNAGDYQRVAHHVLSQRPAPLFIVVGGSGFYIQALYKGMFEVPDISAEEKARVHKWIETEGLSKAYALIQERDPDYALKISEHDSYRIHRALEILLTQNRTMSAIQSEFATHTFPYRHLFLGVTCERSTLRERVQLRTRQMLQSGLLEETQALLAAGFSDWTPLQSVGYKQAVEALRGEIEMSELEPAIVTRTMQLAKRQMTWFRREPQTRWLASDHADDRTIDRAIDRTIDRAAPLITEWLAT